MIKGMALGNRSNKLSLVLGLLLGLVAAALIAFYLSGARDDGATGSGGGVTLPVVLASREIAAGTRIDRDVLTVQSVPESAVLTGAFDKIDSVLGQVTVVPIVAGEQVISSKVTGSGEAFSQYGDNPPLALLLAEGMRAVSVEVNSLTGAGGLIRPGDYVDVILSVKVSVNDGSGASGGSNQVAATILQNVQVLAIDQEVTKAAGAPGAAEEEEDTNPEATTVTLAATPVQGEVLTLADVCRQNFDGRLGLALRSFGDDGRVTVRSEWPADGQPPDCASLLGLKALP